jgi:RimJ/RimL family protein N-acetyltransferase
LILSLADNQAPGALALGAAGHCLYLGRLEEVTDDQIGAAIATLLTSATLRLSLARSAANLVDGAGAMRVAAELVAPAIALRRATAADARMAFAWRNAEENRRYSRNTRLIPLDEHLAWFEQTLALEDRILLIAESEGMPIGVLRYDLQGNAAEVSVYLSPTHHGLGAGRRILREGSSWIKAHYPGVSRLLAEIMPGNDRSARAFAAAGYHHSIDRYEAALC